MSKYGFGQGVMVWFNHANLDQMKQFVIRVENEINHRDERNFGVFLIYMNPLYDQNDATGQGILKGKIQRWCEEQGLQKVDMVWVPSPEDQITCGIFNINPKAINTVLVYKKRKVTAKWVDMNYNDQAINAMLKMIDLPS